MMKEKDIERAVCEYAESLGILQYKFTSPGVRGVPDRIFISGYAACAICEMGICFFIEFKDPSGTLSPIQKLRIKDIQDRGIDVYVIDSVDAGKRIIKQYV